MLEQTQTPEAPSSMRSREVRVASSLVFYFDRNAFVAHNFLTGRTCPITVTAQWILSNSQEWINEDAVIHGLPGVDPSVLALEISQLVESTMLMVSGSVVEAANSEYEHKWLWGPIPGLYHFGIKDTQYGDPDEATSWLVVHANYAPPIPLLRDNSMCSSVVPLGRPPLNDGVLHYMKRRRSYRGFARTALSSAALSRCLFAGFGVTAFATTGVVGHDDIPLKFAPSAGGRNPFDGFVVVRNVEGVSPGAYHYCGVQGTLGLVSSHVAHTYGELLAGQPWFDNAAAVVFLVANFERTMWKYPHHSAYRVVLLEAGHIAQNILLAATDFELASAPTSAIADTLVETTFRLDRTLHGALYAVGLGVAGPEPSQADIPRISFIRETAA